MAQFSQINRTRLAAGLAIDPRHEITPPTSKKLVESADGHPITEVCIVGNATATSTLGDIILFTPVANLPKLFASASPEFITEMTFYHIDDEAAAVRDAMARLKKSKEMTESAPFELMIETKCTQCEHLQQEDADYQAAWKMKQAARMAKRSADSRTYTQAAQMHMNKFNQRKSTLKCNNCKNAGNHSGAVLESEVIEEFVIGRKLDNTSWEHDDKAAVNTASADGKNTDDTMVPAARPEDKNESPTQMKALGELGNTSNEHQGYDTDRKIVVPAKIKQLLKDQIKEAESASKNTNYSQRDDAEFYRDLASMFSDLLNHIEGGTVYDIKQAQIFMTSLMGPMLHKIPAEVVNFLARGGQPGSLRSYMNSVDVKV